MNTSTETLLLRAFAVAFCGASIRKTDTPAGARQAIESEVRR